MDVCQQIRNLPNPPQFFRGLAIPEIVIPKNIICFCAPKLFANTTPDQHNRFVLIQNFKTTGTLCVDGKLIPFEPMHAYLIFPFQQHYYIDVPPNPTWLFTTFALPDHYSSEELNHLRFHTTNIDSKAIKHTQQMLELYQDEDNSISNLRAINLQAAELLNHYLLQKIDEDPICANNQPIPSSLLESVLPLIHNQIHKNLQIAELAESLCCSVSHLSFIFKTSFGMSLGRYIREVKSHKACKLLGTTDMRISTIAQECGYENIYAFSRAFKTIIGQSPKHYRDQYHKNPKS